MEGRGAASPDRATGAATSIVCIARSADPAGIVTIAPSAIDRPSEPAGQAAPDPYKMGGCRPIVAGRCGTGDASAHTCRGEALPRPTAPHGAAQPRSLHRTRRRSARHCADCRTRRLTGPAGPAGQAAPDPLQNGGDAAPSWQAGAAPVMRRPIHGGAGRCLARRATGAAHSAAHHRGRWPSC
jgi:hypothetical protein